MSEFYTDWEAPNGLAAWKKARELFFRYYADFFSGERPLVELVNVPYEDYPMPVLKFNAEKPKGTLITGLLNIVLYGFGWLINIVISGSKDAMACRAGLGRHLLVLRNAWSVSSREITTYAEQCRK